MKQLKNKSISVLLNIATMLISINLHFSADLAGI
mgnify:CR=1 FL=1